MTDSKAIILETPRLILRRLTMDDLDDLVKLYHGPDVRKYYSEGIPSYEETKQELEWMINTCYVQYGFGMWATIDKATGKFIGRCGLTPMDIEGHEEIEVGYMLAREYWGQGLATEAAQASKVAMKIGMKLEVDGDVNGEPTLLYAIDKS